MIIYNKKNKKKLSCQPSQYHIKQTLYSSTCINSNPSNCLTLTKLKINFNKVRYFPQVSVDNHPKVSRKTGVVHTYSRKKHRKIFSRASIRYKSPSICILYCKIIYKKKKLKKIFKN